MIDTPNVMPSDLKVTVKSLIVGRKNNQKLWRGERHYGAMTIITEK